MIPIYRVCIPNTKRDYFDYHSGALSPAIGSRVWVPFGQKTRLGLVVGLEEVEQEKNTLKTISMIIDEKPLMSEEILRLCQWIACYYQSPLSEVLALALPKKYRLGAEAELPLDDFYELIVDLDKAKKLIPARAKKQQALVDFLALHPGPLAKNKVFAAGFSQIQLNALLALGLLSQSQKTILPSPMQEKPEDAYQLNSEQSAALNTISERLNCYHCFLIQGVTGSGKTEVYLQATAKVLAQNRQVLVLVPEIGLTPQLLARFHARFNEPMVVIHSHLNETERQIAWQLAKDNLVKLIIGTRAAVFTPLPNLGLILIDEEHDSSLKQMDGVRYSARDTALMRAFFAKIPIILGSATPSLESLNNCRLNKFSLLRLDQKALNKTPLHYQLVDLRAIKLEQGFAAKSLIAIEDHLNRGNQVLVFINRRGFAPVLLCHHCGWMADCQGCDSHLTLHRSKSERLICHHCGSMKPIPLDCPSCTSKELLPIGAGTERIFEFLQEKFPKAALLRIDRDEVRKKNALKEQLEKINRGEVQLIVGTQMLAKGHHFPRLTLVLVLDTDAGFHNQDFRALERLGQLITQVSGRAGRAEQPGQVLIQTHLPDNPLLNLLIQQGYEAFAKALLIIRQQAKLPPYHYLAAIRAQDKIPAKLLQFLHQAKNLLAKEGLTILGPAPAPLARKANLHRMQLLIKSPSRMQLQFALTNFRKEISINKLANNLRWNVDVDPIDLS